MLAILNSSVAQFYYSKMFGSVKVLRSHLEQIPIPVADKMSQRDIIKAVDQLIEGGGSAKQKSFDEKISRLYGLSTSEYKALITS